VIYTNNEDVFDIASFCYNELDLNNDVIIDVKPLDAEGYCYEDGYVEINNSLPKKAFEIAICHELVHCHQYETRGTADEEEAYNLENKLWKLWKSQ